MPNPPNFPKFDPAPLGEECVQATFCVPLTISFGTVTPLLLKDCIATAAAAASEVTNGDTFFDTSRIINVVMLPNHADGVTAHQLVFFGDKTTNMVGTIGAGVRFDWAAVRAHLMTYMKASSGTATPVVLVYYI